jgi:predicted  nucleic acid-binding Zn-ribbon protein
MNNLYHGMHDLVEALEDTVSDVDIGLSPSGTRNSEQQAMDQMKTDIKGLQKDIANRDATISYYQQIIAKTENTLQEMHDKIAKLSGNMTALCDKFARLEMVNAEMTRCRLDTVDEAIQRNISMSEQLWGIVVRMGRDMKKIQKAAIGLGGRMDYHSDNLYESSSAYYQFIMGTASKYDVHKRLVAKGYVTYKRGDDGVD